MTKDGSQLRLSSFFMTYTPLYKLKIYKIAAPFPIRIYLGMNIKSIERLGCEDTLLNHRWVLNLCK